MSLFYKEIDSPVGKLKLVASDEGLVAVLWEKERAGRVRLGEMDLTPGHEVLLRTEIQLREYFAGARQSFDLPLKPIGTVFQNKVWDALCRIPFGKVRNYGEIARLIGSPDASRAVGAANGRNPLSIIVPCHRVIGKGGALTGFAGGLAAKERLLNLENPGSMGHAPV